jgi:hypothetical protein
MKLSRKQITEGLQSVPMEALLMGAAAAKENRLTPKQRKFAEAIARGESKAGAYRAAYKSNMKPHHESLEGQRLAANPAIARQIEALQLANEAARHATPAALRSLVIQQLTEHALSQDVPPAQRLRALELLGKVTEVAAFTERREIVRTIDAAGARQALLESLRQALRQTSIDAEIVEAVPARGNSVTAKLPDTTANADRDPDAVREGAGAEGTGGAPPARAAASAPALLSNPHIDSLPQSNQSLIADSPVSVTCEGAECLVTGVTGGGYQNMGDK